MQVDAHIDMLKAFVGHEAGLSPWTVIDQDRIDTHARNSGDDIAPALVAEWPGCRRLEA